MIRIGLLPTKCAGRGSPGTQTPRIASALTRDLQVKIDLKYLRYTDFIFFIHSTFFMSLVLFAADPNEREALSVAKAPYFLRTHIRKPRFALQR